MDVEIKPIESSAFTHAGYDKENQELHITFNPTKSGGPGVTYAFPCDPAKAQQFEEADSKGRFWRNNFDRNGGRRINSVT